MTLYRKNLPGVVASCWPQAFGNNAAQLVVLSITPVTSWSVTTAEVALIINGALNFQVLFQSQADMWCIMIRSDRKSSVQ